MAKKRVYTKEQLERKKSKIQRMVSEKQGKTQ